MSSIAKIVGWEEAPVDQAQEHFELCYGAPQSDSTKWPAVARVAAPVDGTVNVQIVLPHGYGSRNQIIFKVLKEIEYYLVDKGEENPWGYAQHHSGSLANCYGNVHWSFIKPEAGSQREPDVRLKKAVILEVGGEGGSIALLANQDSEGNWNRFWLSTNEIAAIESLSDEDLAALGLQQGGIR